MAVPADNPILSAKDDLLGRQGMAATIAVEIRHLDASSGYVVGILGPWGSGKTSLINLIREELGSPPALATVDFNPWLFSGADDLVESFFLEVGAQFRRRSDRLGEIADELEAYGEVLAPLRLLPVLGVWVERARSVVSAIKKARDRRRDGVHASREKLATELAKLDAPVVIVIDDIDRLQTSEIREIFKLVRLTANFPNLVYVLAFDRHRVETALTEEGLKGRDYLEKILQVSWDIPMAPNEGLTTALFQALEDGLSDIDETGEFDDQRWPDVAMEIIRPLIRNLRDVRRYVASTHATVRALAGQVQLVDVLGLEAVRVFLPDVFSALGDAQQGLTTTPGAGLGRTYEDPELKASVERVVSAEPDHEKIARAVINRLFPAGLRHIENKNFRSDWLKRWLRERRVAHPEILKLYLERVAGKELEAFQLAERALPLLTDAAGFAQLIDSLDGDLLAETISALEVYEGEYPVDGVVPSSIVLLNAIPRVPDRAGGFFGMRADIIVDRVVLRMLQGLDSADAVEAAVREILPHVDQLSGRWDLILLVGHREGAGHKLVSEQAAAELEAQLRSQVREATAEQLANEWDLLRLLYFTKRDAKADESTLELPADPALDVALLRSAVHEVRSQTMGNRAVSRSPRLQWETLVEIVGSEDALRELVDRVAAIDNKDEKLREIVDLARRYLEGWRPEKDEH